MTDSLENGVSEEAKKEEYRGLSATEAIEKTREKTSESVKERQSNFVTK